MTTKLEQLRDAIGDILDIVEGWTGPMTDAEKFATVDEIATRAWALAELAT